MMPVISKNLRGGVMTFAVLMLTLIAVDAMAFPSARRNPAMVWSPEARGIILFGGLSPMDSAQLRYEYADTWRLTGTRWVKLYPENSPSPRYGMSMTYDSTRDRILLFGGGTGDEALGDTWSFRDDNWTQIATPNAPPARRLAGFAYDPVRDKAVLFGGGLLEENFNDTWEFDGTTWTLISSNGPDVSLPTLVYDAARDEVLMIGTNTNATIPAVVMYRYANGSWTAIEPENLPPCAGQVDMVYREYDGTVLLYGGSCPRGGVNNETWIWDGTNWSKLALARTAGSIFAYGMAHDQSRNHTVIYGGTSIDENNNTYRLSGDRWILVRDTENPGARTHFVLQKSPDDDHLLLFGGQNATEFFADLWSFRNLEWERLFPEDAPRGCTVPNGAVDPERDRLVIVCSNSDTLEYDGEVFVEKEPTDSPTTRRWSMMAWDPVSRKIILYGGLDDLGGYLDKTWTWDGSEWKELDLKKDQRPPARILATMFLDPVSNRIILAGGLGRPDFNSDFQRYEDQWQFDGTKWVEMTPAQKLPQRYGAQIATDPVNQRVLVFGGKSNTEAYLNDMWAWNGSTWTEVDDGPAPSPRMNGRMAWDPTIGKIVLFGGYAGLYYQELWTFDGSWNLIEEETSLQHRRPVRRPSSSSSTERMNEAVIAPPVDVSPRRRVTLPGEALR